MSATIETDTINYDALEQVKARIQAIDPHLFLLCAYAYESECGTAACIAGHALLLSGEWTAEMLTESSGLAVERSARAFLGLSQVQGGKLFHVEGWPHKFRRGYYDEWGASERRDIAVKRIEHFIQTQGQE